ncbi:MAG: acetolactate synthase large subunit [Francisellaceae bacterium]
MKASDLFLQCLEMQGVRKMYGVPGEENADIMLSLLDSDIDFVTTRHEQTAAFIAAMDGYLTGQPAVCLGTLGPGATNLITGVAQANMDHMPLIVVIGQASTHRLHKVSHQNMDSVDMYRSVTKWAVTIRDADTIPEIVAKAFKMAQVGLPGAVLIELPEDVAAEEVIVKPLPKINVVDHYQSSEIKINEFISLLEEASRPLVLAGDSAVRGRVDQQMAEFLEKTNLFAATTFMGKGVVSDRYQHSLHTVGMGMKDIAVSAFEEADLVICIGYSLVEWAPEKWNQTADKVVVHINVVPAEIDSHYLPKLQLIGNIAAILSQINIRLNAGCQKSEIVLFKQIQDKVKQDLNQDDNSGAFPVKPKAFLHHLRENMADDDMLFSDVGAHKMWVARQYRAYESMTCFISNGFCSMGGSMPSAISAKAIYPDKRVVALCGDGGFIMSIQALATATSQKLPVIIVVWVDDHYGLIKWKQEMHFGKSSHIDLNNPDLLTIAKGFGAYAETLESVFDLASVFARFDEVKDRPCVLFVPIDYSENMKLFYHLKKMTEKTV